MNISRSKIHEIHQYDGCKVVKYIQTIENKDLNETIIFEGHSLESLKSKIRSKMYEWVK